MVPFARIEEGRSQLHKLTLWMICFSAAKPILRPERYHNDSHHFRRAQDWTRPGTLHHVMARGIEGNRIVADDEDRLYIVSRIGKVT